MLAPSLQHVNNFKMIKLLGRTAATSTQGHEVDRKYAVKYIDDEGGVNDAFPGRTVGQVG